MMASEAASLTPARCLTVAGFFVLRNLYAVLHNINSNDKRVSGGIGGGLDDPAPLACPFLQLLPDHFN